MASEKINVEQTMHVEEHETSDTVAADAHLANEKDHLISKWQTIRTQPWAFAWCLFAVWTTLLVSFENNASGVVVGIPEFRKDFGSYYEGNYVLPAKWQSAFSGGPVAATVIGALTAGQVADTVGRKWAIIGALCVSYAAVTLEFVSTTNEMFFGGKFLNGFAVGILAAVCVTYIGEIVPLALRGMMTCLLALAYTVGPFTCALITYGVGDQDTRWAYRGIFISQYGFAAVTTIMVPFMPESPWWLVNKGREDKALRSLRKLGYKNGQEDTRLAVIKVTLDEIRRETEGVSFFECFRKSNLRRTIISIAPLSIQALGGVIFIAAYSTYYFQLAGYSTSDSFKLNVIAQVLSIVGNICSWSLIDRLGRRFLILWGTVSLTIILLITGGLAAAGTPSTIKGAVALILIYNFLYNISIGSSAYTLLCEVATSRLRVKTIAIGIAVQNSWYTMWSFVLPYLFNPNYANLGAKISFIFGGLSVLCSIYLWFYQPETAGRSYEELDELFMKRVPAHSFKGYVTEAESKGQQEMKRRVSLGEDPQNE